jgi:hypothetical protein
VSYLQSMAPLLCSHVSPCLSSSVQDPLHPLHQLVELATVLLIPAMTKDTVKNILEGQRGHLHQVVLLASKACAAAGDFRMSQSTGLQG